MLKRGGSIRDADGNETKVEKEDAKLLVRTVHARTKQEMKYQDKKNKWLGKLDRWGKRLPKEERKPAVWHKEKETKKEVKEVETPVVKAKVSVPLSPAIQKKDMEEKEWKALSGMLEERTAKLEKLKQEEERMTRMERVSGKGRRSKEKAWRKKRKGSEAAEEEKSNWRWL